MLNLTNQNIAEMAHAVADEITKDYEGQCVNVYPVPRGGIPAAYAVKAFDPDLIRIVDDPNDADVFVDDIVDSGVTKEKWLAQYPNRKFYSLVTRTGPRAMNGWVVFPWEGSSVSSIEDNIVRILQYIGEDPTRGGLKETPRRVAKAWSEWCSGYKMKPEDVLKVFEDGANGVDEMVIQRELPFYSHCEHHLAPFFGTVSIAYIPKGRIVGLSKLARLTDVFARRLQVQERLTNQIADALEENLHPKGVGVIIKARHLCMESRGINKQGEFTITSALRGVLKALPEARAEFMELAR